MKQRSSKKGDDGVSPVIAELLLLALALILCALLAACLMNYSCTPLVPSPSEPPEILAIVSVDHYNDKKLTFASKVKLRNIGTKPLVNQNYSAEVYINDVKQYVIINTLQAHDFIDTHHFGISTISGSGPTGYEWEPGNSGDFDLLDSMVQPGCTLRIDIIRKEDGKVISRSIKLIE